VYHFGKYAKKSDDHEQHDGHGGQDDGRPRSSAGRFDGPEFRFGGGRSTAKADERVIGDLGSATATEHDGPRRYTDLHASSSEPLCISLHRPYGPEGPMGSLQRPVDGR
jgi:hypothetical protein